MDPFLAGYGQILRALHDDMRRAVEGLTGAALDWAPAGDANSIAVLVVHATGAERYWIGDVAAGDPSARDRDGEFRTRGVDAEMLAQRVRDVDAYAAGALARLSAADLHQERVSPRDGRRVTAGWALLHALEHTALHLGHIQITRQLWEARS